MEWLKVAWEVFLSFVEDWGDTTLAFLSFGLSVFALIKSSKADKLKNKVNALELKIKEYELEQIEKEKDRESLSCVEARAYDAGNDNYRLRVWNSGNTTAYNISASIDGNPTVRIIDQGKQPFEELASNKSYEMILLTANGSIPKITVITEWYDENNVKHTKRQVLDI